MTTVLDLPQVIEDINTLYSSHDSTRISSVQERLQTYQRSQQGYILGIELLANPNKNVRYFGALTLTVYLNNHVLEDVDSVFNTIVLNLLTLVGEGYDGNLFIIKKLISNLSLIYIKYFSAFARDPVDRLLGTMLGVEQAVSQMIQSLQDKSQVELVLLFLSIILEDITKDSHSMPELHDSVHSTLFQHYKTIYQYLSTVSPLPFSTKVLSLDCITSLVIYISTAEGNSTQRYSHEDMDIFVLYVLQNFPDTVDIDQMEIYNKSFTVLGEILENIPRLVNTYKQQISDMLFQENKFGINFINLCHNNQEFSQSYNSEIENFVNLIIAHLSINLVHITRNILNDSVYNILNVVIFKLTDFPRLPIEDERISEQLIPFWQELADTFIDDSDAISDIIFNQETLEQFNARKIAIFSEISQIYFKKAIVNSPSKEFFQYRTQIGELFILFYSLIQTPIYSTLCGIIQSNLSKTDADSINNLETGLYLIFKITDDLRFYDDEFSMNVLVPLINTFFQGLIESVETIPNYINHQISITLLNLLSCLYFFFKSEVGSVYLPITFNFLFSMILSENTNPKLSLISSKTILKICQDSQDKLVGFLPNLQLIVFEMVKNPTFDNLIRERLVNSYVSIACSVKNPSEIGEKVHQLLLQISQQYNEVVNNTGVDPEIVEEYMTSLLSCVYEIGRAMIIPEELEDYLTVDQINQYNSYWQEDPLSIQHQIISILNQFSLQYEPLIQHTIITEKCCNILKCGLTEPINGPFKFKYSLIFEYLIVKINKCNLQSIPYIYKLIETVVITNKRELHANDLEMILQPTFNDIYQVLESDVDLIKSSIEMFSTILETSPGLILSSELFQSKVLNYALVSLKTYHETFIIKVVVKFWNTLIQLKRGNHQEQQVKNYLMSNLNIGEFPLGYQLASSLMIGFVNSPRSTLDYYYPLFRNLIGKFPLDFKQWLLYYLEQNTHQGKIVLTPGEITQFVNKLMITRGQRIVNDIVRDYWLKVNKLTNY
ncbi:Importin beta-like protein [Spathaspora sp. JA1]|nr:Importin beta-like protein [Spathaspora sp. JA1]